MGVSVSLVMAVSVVSLLGCVGGNTSSGPADPPTADPGPKNTIGDPDGPGELAATQDVPFVCGAGRFATGAAAAHATQLVFATGVVDDATDHMTVLELGPGGSLTATTTIRGAVDATRELAPAGVTSIGTAHVHGADVLAATTADGLDLSLVSNHLATVEPVAHLEGTHVAAAALVTGAGDTFVVAALADDGLHLTSLDRDLTTVASKLYTDPSGFTGVAAASYAGTSLVAWSTADRCHVQFTTAELPTDGTHLTVPCPDPQLAVDAHGDGLVAYLAPNGVMVSRLVGQQLQPEQLVGPGGRDPHVASDGAHLWLSYVGASGKVASGLVDATGRFHPLVMPDLSATGATQLAPYATGVMAMAATSTGLAAQDVCTTTADAGN